MRRHSSRSDVSRVCMPLTRFNQRQRHKRQQTKHKQKEQA